MENGCRLLVCLHNMNKFFFMLEKAWMSSRTAIFNLIKITTFCLDASKSRRISFITTGLIKPELPCLSIHPFPVFFFFSFFLLGNIRSCCLHLVNALSSFQSSSCLRLAEQDLFRTQFTTYFCVIFPKKIAINVRNIWMKSPGEALVYHRSRMPFLPLLVLGVSRWFMLAIMESLSAFAVLILWLYSSADRESVRLYQTSSPSRRVQQ